MFALLPPLSSTHPGLSTSEDGVKQFCFPSFCGLLPFTLIKSLDIFLSLGSTLSDVCSVMLQKEQVLLQYKQPEKQVFFVT